MGLLAIIATSLPCRDAEAGGFTITVMGGRRSSSLVVLGRPDDPSALFHNPAGLADQKGAHLHLSGALMFVASDFRMKALDPVVYEGADWPVDAEGYYTSPMEPESTFGVIPYLGASTDLGFLGRRGRQFVASAALYLPAFYGATFPEEAPSQYHVIDGFLAVGSATFGVGWRPSRYVSVGASLSYNYMRISNRRRYSTYWVVSQTPAAEFADLAQAVVGDLTIEYSGVDHGVGWGVGVLVTPVEWLSIGIVYSGATEARFRGPIDVTGRNDPLMRYLVDQLALKLPRELIVSVPVPHSLNVGINIAPRPWIDIGLDFRTWHYQVYKRQKVVPLYDPSEPGEEALSEEMLSANKVYSLSYELAFGVAVRPLSHTRLDLMAGVSYDRSPIPDQFFSLDNPNLSSINVATGVRWAITPHWRATVSFNAYIYLRRSVDVSLTTPPLRGVGRGVAYVPGFELQYTF